MTGIAITAALFLFLLAFVVEIVLPPTIDNKGESRAD